MKAARRVREAVRGNGPVERPEPRPGPTSQHRAAASSAAAAAAAPDIAGSRAGSWRDPASTGSWADSSTSTRRQLETAGQAPWLRSGTPQARRCRPGRADSPQRGPVSPPRKHCPGRRWGRGARALRGGLPARAVRVSVTAARCCPADLRCARAASRSSHRARTRSRRTRHSPRPPRPTGRPRASPRTPACESW